MEPWKGKIAVVTGASSGIGAQILQDLANSGMIVIGLARRKERVLEFAKKNKNAADRIFAHECDLSRTSSIKTAFRWIEATFGVIHVLINNAGCRKIADTLSERITNGEIQAIINTNLIGLVLCTREAYRMMLKHSELAFIVNLNSILGHGSAHSFFRFANVYSAAKQAIRHHTDTIRLDLIREGNERIRVSSISPGLVKTEMVRAAGGNDSYYNRKPHLTVEDVADAIIHVLSAPQNVTVTELIIRPTGERF